MITIIEIKVHIYVVSKLKPKDIFRSLYVESRSIGRIKIIINATVKPMTIITLTRMTP